VLLKVSQNLYADTLLKAIGRPADGGPATRRKGAGASRDSPGLGHRADRYLQGGRLGIVALQLSDGRRPVAVLTRMYADNRHIEPFINALPVAGVDGTIAGRMKDTVAQGNARAKTGSNHQRPRALGLRDVGRRRAARVSMIVNNFNVPQSRADAVIDARSFAWPGSGASQGPPWPRRSRSTRS